MPHSGIGIHNVGLDRNFLLWQPRLNEFPAAKLAGNKVAVHLIHPSSSGPVKGKHESDGAGCQARVLIAAIAYTSPETVLEALLAGLPVPEKSPGGAKQPIVRQCLHDRDICLLAGIVSRWRDEWERVVEVGDFRPLPLQDLSKLLV